MAGATIQCSNVTRSVIEHNVHFLPMCLKRQGLKRNWIGARANSDETRCMFAHFDKMEISCLGQEQGMLIRTLLILLGADNALHRHLEFRV
jgi:hypothetical protein